MVTTVSSSSATTRKVSCVRPASGMLAYVRPHVDVGMSCSTMWSQ